MHGREEAVAALVRDMAAFAMGWTRHFCNSLLTDIVTTAVVRQSDSHRSAVDQFLDSLLIDSRGRVSDKKTAQNRRCFWTYGVIATMATAVESPYCCFGCGLSFIERSRGL